MDNMTVFDLISVVRDTKPTFIINFGGVFHGFYTLEELATNHELIKRELWHVQTQGFNDGIIYILDVF